jgi:Spy/CpxP family protein refolding chaperone
MKIRKLSVIGGAALCALAWGGVAGAQEQRGPRPDGPGGQPPMERMMERLGLSEDQKAAVHAVIEKDQDTMRPLADAARGAHDAFQKALDAPSPDATKVGQLAIAMNTAQKKFDSARKAEMEKIKEILTPEQQERLEQAMQRGFGRGPGGPGGPGGQGGPQRPDGPPNRN